MIGIDFDNTIVCYEQIFGRVAIEQGLVPPEAAKSKTAIRDQLRSIGQEDRFTELQGAIYGARIEDAPPYPGVVEFLSACREAGVPTAIVSHRTRFPLLGRRHDLHAAARGWLTRHGFHDSAGIGIPEDRVFFEETKEAKLARIAEIGCTHFIDDLPELLVHPLFPKATRRVLFAPHGQIHAAADIDLLSSWNAAPALFASLTESGTTARFPSLQKRVASCVVRLPGSGNNRVYRVDSATGPILLKEYFRYPGDPRDRLGAEQAFLNFAWNHGLRGIPQPLACDRDAGVGMYEFLDGRKLSAGEVTAAHVDVAAEFISNVNRGRHRLCSAALPIASEGCFSLKEHLDCVDRRLTRLSAIEPMSDLDREAATLVVKRLLPAWQRVRGAVEASGLPLASELAVADRVISPSDFGFHNAILTTDGRLKFIDFEYAGWDDPAKTVCDFFCQPEVPVPHDHLERFLSALDATIVDRYALRERVRLLFPGYQLKWCCIMLNEFLPIGDNRRSFARSDESRAVRQAAQLRKAKEVLGRLNV